MKRTYRLTAFLLALLMLVNLSATAMASGITLDELDIATYQELLAVATVEDETPAFQWGYIETEKNFNDTSSIGSNLGTVPANSFVKVFGTENSMYKVEYNGQIGYVSAYATIPVCVCGDVSQTDPAMHDADCAYPKYFKQLANEKTAVELYALWNGFSAEEQAFVLAALKDTDEDKYAALCVLLNPPAKPEKTETTDDGTTVTVSGSMPENVQLELEPLADETAEELLPGLSQLKLEYIALDIKLMQDGQIWQPGETVQVTISAADIGVDGDVVAIFHNHDGRNEYLGLYEIAGGKVTFDVDGFSCIVIVKGGKNQTCWVEDLEALETATERYAFLNEKYKEAATEFSMFMWHYADNHSDLGLVCICGIDAAVPVIYAPGDANHIADCPWNENKLPVNDNVSETVGDVTVSVNGAFPESVELNVSQATDEAISSYIPDISFTPFRRIQLDISLMNANAEWEPSAPVKVTISVNDLGETGDTIALFRLHDGQVEYIGTAVMNNSSFTFTSDGFSYILGVNVSDECTDGADCGYADFVNKSIAEKEQALAALYNSSSFEYSMFIAHVRAYHAATADLCLCDMYDPATHHHGSYVHKGYQVEWDTFACPWAFKSLSVEEQAAVLLDKTEDERAPYLETLTEDQKAALEEYMNSNTDRTLPTVHGSISGKIPAGTVAVMDVIGTNAALVNALVPADAFMEGTMTTKAYDMKLKDANGNAWMPTEPVTVQVNGIVDTSLEDPLVAVIHLLDSAEAIAKEQANGNVYTIEDAEVVAAFSAELAAAQEAGLGDVVAFTGMTSENGAVTVNADGSVTFQTNSFSDYYVSAGTATSGDRGNNWTQIGNEDVHTFHVEAGTTFTFNHSFSSWSPRNYTQGYEQYFTTNRATLTVSTDAPIGTQVTYDVSWDQTIFDWLGGSATLTFIVKSRSDVVDGTLNSEEYPVLLSLLYGTTQIPAEPGVTSTFRYTAVHGGDTYTLGGNSRIFATTANGIIKPEIKDALIASVDGTSVLGIYDATGVNTLKYIEGIDWNKVLDAVAESGAYSAIDGQRVTTANKNNYKIIPYVVKIMTVQDAGWHIDCAIVLKENVTISYDLNLQNYVAEGITLPSAESKLPMFIHTVGRISGLKTINNIQNSVNATLNGDSYTLKFLGWSTDPNATEPTYQPGDTIRVDDNTVLYAIWEGTPDPGILKIKKTVQSNGGVQAPADDEFTFKVVFNGAGSLNYQITNAEGAAVSTGTIESTGTLKLKAGQTATIDNVPVGAYTVTEEPKANYTTTSTNASGTIKTYNSAENNVSVAEFVNTYTKPTSNLKITKQLAEGSATDPLNRKFTFEVTLPAGTYQYQIGSGDVQELQIAEGGTGTITLAAGETATIKDVDIGTEYTIQENDLLGYEVTSITGATTNDASTKTASGTIAAADSEVVFTNTYKTGNLSIEKTVDGVCAPADAEFTFTIEVEGNIAGTYSAVKKSVTESVIFTHDTATDRSTASVTLKHGENIEIQKLPKNAEYTVTEVYEAADYQCVSTDASGTISDTAVSAASFVNTYLRGELTIEKQLASGTTAEAGQMFLFTVKGPEFSEPLTITLAPGGKVTLTDLKLGTYTVEEDTEWSGRYQPDNESNSAELSTSNLEATLTFTNTKANDQWLDANAVVTNRFEKVPAEETQE